MAEPAMEAFEIVVQQRFQELEGNLLTTERQLKDTTTKLASTEQNIEQLQAERDQLRNELISTQTEKLKLTFEIERRQEREAASARIVGIDDQVNEQLKTVMEKLDMCWAERGAFKAETQELHKEVDALKKQLRKKDQEMGMLQEQADDRERQVTSLRGAIQQTEERLKTLRSESNQRMEEWFTKERIAQKQIGELMIERDTLKTCLQKKHDDHLRTHGILKKTTDAFGECLSAFKHGSDKLPEAELLPPESSMQLHGTPLMLPSVNFDEQQYKRTSKSEQLSMIDVEDISAQELADRHHQLIIKFNEEVQASLKDEANARKLMVERNMAASENMALSLRLSELRKAIEHRDNRIQSITEQMRSTRDEQDAIMGSRILHDNTLVALQKTNDDYAAQLKFLVKKIAMYEKTADKEKGAKHARPLQPEASGEGSTRPGCIHDIVEENKELIRENYRLKLDLEDVSKKLLEEDGNCNDAIVGEYAADEGRQKRTAITQSGPSKKKQKRASSTCSSSEDEIEDDWKEKWTTAQEELSTLRANHLQLETQLKQALERAETKNANYLGDLKAHNDRLMEYKVKYDTLMETYKTAGTSFKSQMQTKAIRIRELDAVIAKMYKETSSLKEDLTQQQTEREIDARELQKEKRAYSDLQSRVIRIEAEHQIELHRMQESIQAQIEENIQKRSVFATGRSGEHTFNEAELAEAMKDLKQQLEDKDRVILELERRIQMSTEPLNADMMYDLKSQLALAQSRISIDEDQIRTLQGALLQSRQQYETQLQSIKEEYHTVVQEKEEEVTKLEAERDATNLEILRWKGQCDQYQSREKTLQQELAATRVTKDESIQDLKARLRKLQTENESLKAALEERQTELKAEIERARQLTKEVHERTNEVRKLERENSELSVKLIEHKDVEILIEQAAVVETPVTEILHENENRPIKQIGRSETTPLESIRVAEIDEAPLDGDTEEMTAPEASTIEGRTIEHPISERPIEKPLMDPPISQNPVVESLLIPKSLPDNSITQKPIQAAEIGGEYTQAMETPAVQKTTKLPTTFGERGGMSNLSSLLELARSKVTVESPAPMASSSQPNTDRQPTTDQGLLSCLEDTRGTMPESSNKLPVVQGEDRAKKKIPKWTPIVYEDKKKHDHPEDKKKDRGPKH